MKIFPFLTVLLFASCSETPAIIPILVPQAAVKSSAPVTPSASAVRTANEQVARNAERVEQHVDTVNREAAGLREGLQSAVAEADRLRQAKTATQADLDAMWQRLTELSTRNLFLESEAQAAQKDLVEQKQLRADSDARIAELQVAATAKDAEAQQLRMQYQDEQALRSSDHAAAADSATALAAATSRADKLAGEVRLYRWIAVIVGALIILFVVVRWFLPRPL